MSIKELITEEGLINGDIVQTTERIEENNSVSIPMKFISNKEYHDGWINIDNAFTGVLALGASSSERIYYIIEPIMEQLAAKGFSMMVYDYKFPTLAVKLYYNYCINKKAGKTPEGCSFNIINFSEVEYSHCVNPIQEKYFSDDLNYLTAAQAFVRSLGISWNTDNNIHIPPYYKGLMEHMVAACMNFFVNYKEGKYSDLPHVLSFFKLPTEEIIEILKKSKLSNEIIQHISDISDTERKKDIYKTISILRRLISRIPTKENYWILRKDGDDIDLYISDPKNPSYLLIANDPEKQDKITPLVSTIIHTIEEQTISNFLKNKPTAFVIDNIESVYLPHIDRNLCCGREENASMIIGSTNLHEIKNTYGNEETDFIQSVAKNVLSTLVKDEETINYLTKDVLGKKANQEQKRYDFLVEPEEIKNMPHDWIVGSTSRDFFLTEKENNYFCKVGTEYKEKEKKQMDFKSLPKYHTFKNEEEKETLLTENYTKITREVEGLYQEIFNKNSTN